jgi:uncharacterized protein (DUF924 family)
MQPKDVTQFWFDELSDDDRWTLCEKLDETIADRFGETHRAASVAELWEWRDSPVGRLTEIIVLDQFSRHIFRNKPGAFANDAAALVLAQEAVRVGADQAVNESMRLFFYMPFMHSESLKVHAWAIDLFSRLDGALEYEESHRKLIERFGRYPHRNEILGRKSTPDELQFLKTNKHFGGQGLTGDSGS